MAVICMYSVIIRLKKGVAKNVIPTDKAEREACSGLSPWALHTGLGSVYTLLEKFWRSSLYMTDDAIASSTVCDASLVK